MAKVKTNDADVTPLEERMKLVVPGQATWPEPKLNRKCSECRYLKTSAHDTHRQNFPSGMGICVLNYSLGQAKPKPFLANAIACPQIEVFTK